MELGHYLTNFVIWFSQSNQILLIFQVYPKSLFFSKSKHHIINRYLIKLAFLLLCWLRRHVVLAPPSVNSYRPEPKAQLNRKLLTPTMPFALSPPSKSEWKRYRPLYLSGWQGATRRRRSVDWPPSLAEWMIACTYLTLGTSSSLSSLSVCSGQENRRCVKKTCDSGKDIGRR